MARIVDITGRIKTDEVFLVLDGKQYKLNDDKNTVIEAMAVVNSASDDIEGMDKALDLFLGKKSKDELTKGISFAGYQALFISIMAEVTNRSYEEVSAQFRG